MLAFHAFQITERVSDCEVEGAKIVEHSYLRDGRAPLPLKESTSRVMSANKAKNTKPEIALRKVLWKDGLRGYRLNWKKAPGRPDIAFPGRKIAIFVNGCFWHGCPYCRPSLPKSHRSFWKQKFKNNKLRDRDKVLQLKRTGWKVLTIWECQLRKHPQRSVLRIKELLTIVDEE
ncbi:MAG: very short patch repair endonuclease [Anaerolineae bacterium]